MRRGALFRWLQADKCSTEGAGHFLRLDRTRKARMKSLWHPGLCRGERSFKPYQNEHGSVKEATEKGQKPCKIDAKIPIKFFPTTRLHFLPSNPTILNALRKTFAIEMKLSKYPAKGKKRAKKSEKEELVEEQAKWFRCYRTVTNSLPFLPL